MKFIYIMSSLLILISSLFFYGLYKVVASPIPVEDNIPTMTSSQNNNRALDMKCTHVGQEIYRCQNWEVLCYKTERAMNCFPLNLPKVRASSKVKGKE